MTKQPDLLQVQDIKSKGYGTITQIPMRDKRLSKTAKSIYSYLCSYAGVGNSAFPRRDTILSELDIGIDTYCKYMKQLKELGYIKVTQERNKAGRFSRNVYTLVQEIPITPSATYREHEIPTQVSAPCREKPNTKSPDTEKPDTYIFKKNHLKDTSNSFNNYHVMSSQSEDKRDTAGQKIAAYTEIIKDNIHYYDFSPLDRPLVDEFIMIIIDVMLTENRTIRIKGEDRPGEAVKQTLMRLDNSDIEHDIAQLKAVTKPINNKWQYMLTMMFINKREFHAHYTNMVNSY